MRSPSVVLLLLALGATTPAHAQATGAADSIAPAPPAEPPAATTGVPATSASLTNPAISVIGWFQALAGNDSTVQDEAFEFREAEIALQAAVDPFTRADFFIAAGPEGLEVEEGYVTWLALPGGGQARVGKFRADLGKFNRTHPPETPFADRPLATVAFLGEEGLSTTGVSLSALVPNPMDLYWDVTANLGAPPDPAGNPLFEASSRADVLALGRTSLFVPLRESADLNLGVSYASGPALASLRADGSRAQLGAADLTFRWKNPRRSIYRSLLVQVEAIVEQGSRPGAGRYAGAFGYAVWQFARQWRIGVRRDWTESPGDRADATGVLALLTCKPSEFSTLSLQARRVRAPGGTDRAAAFFKWTFNIGPHGADPY